MARPAALVAVSLAVLLPSALHAAPPRQAPPVYATANYGLTFRTPPGATYCPLPRDWVGSDHGTTLFLVPPRRCGDGAGYPSTSRSFTPDVPRIDLYYGFVAWDNPAPLPKCAGGHVSFASTRRPICIRRHGRVIAAELHAYYRLDQSSGHSDAIPSEVYLTLVTQRARLAADLGVLRRLAASLKICSTRWPAANGHPSFVVGIGPPCPNVGTF